MRNSHQILISVNIVNVIIYLYRYLFALQMEYCNNSWREFRIIIITKFFSLCVILIVFFLFLFFCQMFHLERTQLIRKIQICTAGCAQYRFVPFLCFSRLALFVFAKWRMCTQNCVVQIYSNRRNYIAKVQSEFKYFQLRLYNIRAKERNNVTKSTRLDVIEIIYIFQYIRNLYVRNLILRCRKSMRRLKVYRKLEASR